MPETNPEALELSWDITYWKLRRFRNIQVLTMLGEKELDDYMRDFTHRCEILRKKVNGTIKEVLRKRNLYGGMSPLADRW